jgi:hypothetical protein
VVARTLETSVETGAMKIERKGEVNKGSWLLEARVENG